MTSDADARSTASDLTDASALDEKVRPEHVPDDVEPVFLTGSTMTILKAAIGVNVTEDNPFKIVGKDELLEDIEERGVVSDFHALKDKIEAAKPDDFLLVWDQKREYSENFYLCLSDAVRKSELTRLTTTDFNMESIEAAWKEVDVDEVKVKGDWKTLGSSDEVNDMIVEPQRPLLVVSVTRRRAEFGAPYKFGDRDAHDTFLELRQFKDPNFDMRRMELDAGVQAVPEHIALATQTPWYRPVNGAVQYEPVSIEAEEKEAMLKSETLTDFLRSVGPEFEYALEQNEAVNIYRNDFAVLAEDEGAIGTKSGNALKEFASFADLIYCKDKYVSWIDWQPAHRGIVAVSVCDNLTFDESVELSGRVRTSAVLVWNFIDPIQPQMVLESPNEVTCFAFNPENPGIVVGGCANGQVIMWDISEQQEALKARKGQEEEETSKNVPIIQHQVVSTIENGHRRAVTDLVWLSDARMVSNHGKVSRHPEGRTTQFVTIAGDGQVLFWDMRVKKDAKRFDVLWNPVHRVTLAKGEGSSGEVGGSHLAIGDAGDGTQFFCATEEGELIGANWHPDEADEKPRFLQEIMVGHYGACTALERSPFFHDILLTVGDWTFNLWRDGVSKPIFTSPCAPTPLRTGCWSPTRPGVIYLGRVDGKVDIWDLTDRSHEPSLTQTITSAAVTSIQFWTAGKSSKSSKSAQHLVAIGDAHGTLHVKEVTRALARPVSKEEEIVEGLFEREVKRVAYVKKRFDFRRTELADKEREAAMRERELEEANEAAAGMGHTPDMDEDEQGLGDADEAQRAADEAAYRMLEANFKAELGVAAEDGDAPDVPVDDE